MNIKTILIECERSMDLSIEQMSKEYKSVRTGKASPSLVENLDIEAYGTTMKLNQLALITTPESRLLVIQPFDVSTIRDIEKGINQSHIGINPAVDGKLIRLPIPELSEERRKDLTKQIKEFSEDCKIKIRSHRRTALDEAKKSQKKGTITEDDLRRAEKDIQDLTDTYVEEVDTLFLKKEKELMTV
jgi:ribosome recycling factor